MTRMYGLSCCPLGGVVSAGYVLSMYAWNWSPSAVSIGFRAPLETQLLTRFGSVGPGAMSGRSVPAAMPLASWLVESRFVVRWTLMPVWSLKGLRTSWNAFNSAPPQAVQTVTSVLEAPPPVPPPPPDEQAISISVPRPAAIALEASLVKTSDMGALSSKSPAGRHAAHLRHAKANVRVGYSRIVVGPSWVVNLPLPPASTLRRMADLLSF